MKRLISILIFFASCGEQTKQHNETTVKDSTIQKISRQEDTSSEKDTADSFIDPRQFKVARQDSFSLQDWYYGARQKKLVKLTAQEIEKYFQDSELKSNPAHGEENYYFFSVQENDKERKVITLIEEYDFCCADLLLMTYDQDNKLIGKSKVAGTGGDGGWAYDEYGKFVSDSMYQLIRVDQENIRDDPDTMEYKIDSLVTQFSVDKHLNFEKKDEEQFERKKIITN